LFAMLTITFSAFRQVSYYKKNLHKRKGTAKRGAEFLQPARLIIRMDYSPVFYTKVVKNVLKTDRLTKPLSAKGLQSVDSLFRD
jgi:hypothetical protein